MVSRILRGFVIGCFPLLFIGFTRPLASQTPPPPCQTGCIPPIPAPGFYYSTFVAGQILPPETGPYTYQVYLKNVGNGDGNFEVWCQGSGQFSCSATPASVFLALWDSTLLTVTYSVKGLGSFRHTVQAIGSNESGSKQDSLRQGADTVRGSSIAAHLNPLNGADFYNGDTLKSIFSHPSGVDSSTFRLLIDGLDSTSRAVKTDTSIKASGLGLSGGAHIFGTYACAINFRCDSTFTSFNVVTGVSGAVLDDSLGPGTGFGLEGVLPGGLPLPDVSLRGCPVNYDDPEIRLITPFSYITQPANPGAGLPTGYIFRASAIFGTTLPITMSVHDWRVADSTSCSNSSPHRVYTYSYLTPSQYDWTYWQNYSHTDPLWDSYPYPDWTGPHGGGVAPSMIGGLNPIAFSSSSGSAGAPGGAGVTSGSGGRRGGGRVRVGPLDQNPGAIDFNSYQVYLNGVLIVNNAQPVAGTGVTRVYADVGGAEFDLAATSSLLHHYNPSNPTSDNGGWNELTASVADSTGHRTTVRARFPAGTGDQPAALTLAALRDFSHVDQGECAAFGALQCGGVELTQTIPGFVTRDKDRNLHLVYRSASQRAAQLLPVDVQINRIQTAPDSMWIWPTSGGIQVGGTLRYYGTKRAAGTVDADTLWDDASLEHRVLGVSVDTPIVANAAIRPVTARVRSFYPGSVIREDTVGTEVVYVQLSDTTMSRYGQGWTLAEQERLILGLTSKGAPAAIWVSGDGSSAVFRQVGGVWLAPLGETAHLVDSTGAAPLPAAHVLYLDNGASVGFRGDGWQVYTADLVGNRTRFIYASSTSSRLDSIADPSGVRYQFTYTSGKVTAVAIRGTGGNVQTMATFSYDGSGRLTSVMVPRTATLTDTTSFAYVTGAPGAFVQTVTDPRSTTLKPIVTTFAYDNLYYLPTSITRPPDRSGAGVTDYRDPLRRVLPRVNRGRGTSLAERPAYPNWYKGTLVNVARRASDFTVDRFGGPTWVRRYAPPVGSPTCPNVFPPIPSCADDVRRIDRDTIGRVVKIVADPDYPNVSDSVSFIYDALSRVDTLIRNTLKWPIVSYTRDTISYVYDSLTVDPVSGVGRAWCSRLKSMKDPMGGVTTVVYGTSSAGADRCLPQKAIGLAQDTTIFTYGTLSPGVVAGVRPVKVRDPNGLADSVQYDAATWNSLVHVRMGDLATTRAYYNQFGWPDSTTNPLGVRSELRYDLSGRVIKTRTGPTSSITTPTVANFFGRGSVLDSTQVYNSAGIDAAASGTIQTTRNYFDRLGWVDSTLTPGVAGTRRNHHFLRDRYGTPVLDYPGNGAYVGRITDWQGRVTSIAESQVYPGYSMDGQPFADATTNSTYLGFGLKAGPTLSAGQGYGVDYDEKGRPFHEWGQQVTWGGSPQFAFYERWRSFTNVNTVWTETLKYGDGVTVIRKFEFNRRGQRTKMTDSLTLQSGTWVTGAETKGVMRYFYDSVTARMDSLVDSSAAVRVGRVRWLYDRGGRDTVRAVLLPGADAEYVSTTRYDAAGRVSFRETRKPSGANAAVWYQLSSPSYDKADLLSGYATLEPNGTALPNPQARSYTMRYDSLATGRMLHSEKSTFTNYDWTYDTFGNRLSESHVITTDPSCNGNDIQTSTFAADNALVRTTGVSCNRLNHYYSDHAGSRLFQLDSVQNGSGSYGPQQIQSYTASSHLYFSMTPAASAGLFDYNWHLYDAGGMRLETVVLNGSTYTPGSLPSDGQGVRTLSVYDGSDVALTIVKSGTTWWVAQRYLTGGLDDQIAGRFNPYSGWAPQNLVLMADNQGTTMAAVKADGTQETNAVYYSHSPFGSQEAGSASGSGSLNPGTGFTGASAPNAGSGFVYLRNRWYDPKTGRFLIQDPIGLAGGVNLYAYAGNNPIMFTDPFGLRSDSTFVNCATLGGEGTSGVLAHCALRVVNPQLHIDATIQMASDPSGRQAFRIGVTRPHDQETVRFKKPWSAVQVPHGMTVNQFDQKVLGSAMAIALQIQGLPYNPDGKFNSNAFVYDVITKAGGKVPASASRGFLFVPGICGGSGGARGTNCSN